MNDTTVSRRRALQTGGLAAIAASLLGTAGTASAQPAPAVAAESPVLATVVNYPDLAEDVRAWVKAHHDAVAKEQEASAALEDRLGRELYVEVMQFVEGPFSAMHDAWEELVLVELARHLPGMAPAMRLVWEHVYATPLTDMGTCCVPETEATA